MKGLLRNTILLTTALSSAVFGATPEQVAVVHRCAFMASIANQAFVGDPDYVHAVKNGTELLIRELSEGDSQSYNGIKNGLMTARELVGQQSAQSNIATSIERASVLGYWCVVDSLMEGNLYDSELPNAELQRQLMGLIEQAIK